jgi:phage/plasmid-like protein (TIGR03299 family)
MSHMVERMAYYGEKPWHGLGYQLPERADVDQMLVAAGLDWTVQREPVVYLSRDGIPVDVPDTYALVRSLDGKVLASCGRQYKPVQNRQAFEFFREFVEAGDATMETAGSLDDGRYVWGLANLNNGFKLGNGTDESKGYLLVGCPHKPGRSLIIRHTMIRVVCWNTLTAALSGSGQEFRMRHTRKFDDGQIREARLVLGIAREQTDEFREQAEALEKVIMAYGDVVSLYRDVYQPDANQYDRNNRAVQGVLGSYFNAPGATPGTGWGVLNGATHFEDHTHGRTRSSRLKSAWLGAGAANKTKVLAALLQGAGV